MQNKKLKSSQPETYLLFLGHVVLGALTSLRHLPVDVLVRRLDITCLAVNAAVVVLVIKFTTQYQNMSSNLLLRVDLESNAMGLRLVLNILVHASWAEA